MSRAEELSRGPASCDAQRADANRLAQVRVFCVSGIHVYVCMHVYMNIGREAAECEAGGRGTLLCLWYPRLCMYA